MARHLAILGSYALALRNPAQVRHYYLATSARLTRRVRIESLIRGTGPLLPMTARAQALELDKRQGKAAACLYTQNGEALFDLEVTYSVLRTALFQRIFCEHWKPEPVCSEDNPYVHTPEVTEISRTNDVFLGTLGTIRPEQCLGHFDNISALPVAVLSGALGVLASSHLESSLSSLSSLQVHYAGRCVKVVAHRLALAGEKVELASRLVHRSSKEAVFEAAARGDARGQIADARIEFDIAASDPPDPLAGG